MRQISGQVARYNCAEWVAPPIDWRGRDFKYFQSFFVEMKLFLDNYVKFISIYGKIVVVLCAPSCSSVSSPHVCMCLVSVSGHHLFSYLFSRHKAITVVARTQHVGAFWQHLTVALLVLIISLHTGALRSERRDGLPVGGLGM